MDYGESAKRAIGLIAIAAFAQDPFETLERARDKMLSEIPTRPRYTRVETIDRSYFSRRSLLASPASCERLSADRKQGRTKLRLDATDRLRVEVAVTQGTEIYSWTRPASFSYPLEQILQFGPTGTGAFAAHLIDLFSNPSVRFRTLEEPGENLAYAFRVPIEASYLIIKAGTQWRPSGYSGSFTIDPRSLEMRRFTMESDELPPETSLCEVSTTNEYLDEKTLGLLLPSVSHSHDILRDATETELVTTFSDCHESPPPSASDIVRDLALPEQTFELALSTPIDPATAAAGDAISARLTGPILGPKSSEVLAQRGSTVTGRIVQMENRVFRRNYYVVTMAFDRVQVDGKFFKLRIKSDGNTNFAPYSARPDPEWPLGTFAFPGKDRRYVIPAGFKSKWFTVPRAQPPEAQPHSAQKAPSTASPSRSSPLP
jgi:hypothetical protein